MIRMSAGPSKCAQAAKTLSQILRDPHTSAQIAAHFESGPMLKYLLACLLLLPGLARADEPVFGDCTSAHYLAQFDEVSGRTGCDIRHEQTIQVHGAPVHLRIISLPGTSNREDSGWIPLISETFIRVGSAIDAMGSAALLPNVTVLLSDHEGIYGGATAHGVTFWGADLADECAITVFKLNGGAATLDFAVTFAHEIFHCVQRLSWHDSGYAAGSTWWVEGSAEYFGAMVAPDSGSSASFVDLYGDTTMDHALYERPSDYENVVFFDRLHQVRGASGVGDFLAAMPAHSNYLSVLPGLFGLDDWAQFAEDYLQGLVTEPGGTNIPIPVTTLHLTAAEDSGSFDLVAKPYRVFRFDIAFAEPGDYRLSVDLPASVRARVQVAEGDWMDFPQTLHACGDLGPVLVYLVTTSEPTPVSLHYEKTGDCTACERVIELDRCLIGTWELTGGGPIEWMREQGMQRHIQVEASQMTVMMTRDGGYILNPVTVTAQADNHGNPGNG